MGDRPPFGGGGAPRGRTGFCVAVSGMGPDVSWQDLKDFMRAGGDVIFTRVNPDGTGMAEFSNAQDVEEAVKRLDGRDLRGHAVTVREDIASDAAPARGGHGRARSRSPERDRRDYRRDYDRRDDRRDRRDYDRRDDRRDYDRRDDDRRDDRRDDDRRSYDRR